MTTRKRGHTAWLMREDIRQGGLALMAVQHVLESGGAPTGELGAQFGSNAAAHAQAVGIPAGVNLWLDLEGVKSGTAEQDVIDYCTNWFGAVDGAGYAAGIYVGANCGLSASQLSTLPFQYWWKSLSNVPTVPGHPYQMVQSATSIVNGIGIDSDTAFDLPDSPQVCWWPPVDE